VRTNDTEDPARRNPRAVRDSEPDPERRTQLQCHPDTLPIVRLDREGRRSLDLVRWGLVPWWSMDIKMGARCINAMAETVATKPAFRDAFNRSQRCLVPVDGFYEWQKRPGGKQPYAIVGADGKPLALAGLWDRWREPGSGQPVQSSNLRWSDRLARELAGTAADARRCRAY
jgi:putative SOS response-associated peptidase YedK